MSPLFAPQVVSLSIQLDMFTDAPNNRFKRRAAYVIIAIGGLKPQSQLLVEVLR
jgi:hypothetical protein